MATTKDIEDMLKFHVGEIPQPELLSIWVEMGRKEVEGGLGKWPWRKLQRLDTIALTTASDYIIPGDALADSPIERIIAIKAPGINNKPIPILSTDEYVNTLIEESKQYIVILGFPDPGFINIRISEPPTGGSLEIWYQTKSKDGDLDFVPRYDHSVFYWAALQFAMTDMKIPNVGRFSMADVQAIYNNRMEMAIRNDYYSRTTSGLLVPPLPALVFRDKLQQIQARR